MIIHSFPQGSTEWLAHRRNHFNASDAAAMMGVSPYKTRTQLIHEIYTGMTAEVDAGTQRRFDDGHHFERLARPLAEKIIGQPLYPVVGSKGKISASFDGLTMDQSKNWEHKSLNEELRAVMTPECSGADLPLLYRVQMQQQCDVAESEKTLFSATKWEGDRLVEERHCWYTPDAELSAEIVAGWEQLEKDVAAYKPAPVEHAATPTAKLRDELPALVVNVTGQVTESNLDEFKAVVMQRIADIPAVLETDQQFVDGDVDAKWLRDVADAMRSAMVRVRSGLTSVNTVLTTLEQLEALADTKAINLEKKVKIEKQARKENIVLAAQAGFSAHVASLNNELAPLRINPPQPDFDTATKGLKTLPSIRNKVDGAMAAGKIAADGMAKDVSAKAAWFKEVAAGHDMLFADLQQLVSKPMEDFQLAVEMRVSQHKAAELAKEEAQREKIRQEERQKLEREQAEAARQAAAKVEAEKAAAAELERQAEAAKIAAAAAAIKAADPAPAQTILAQAAPETVAVAAPAAATPAAPAPNVVALRAAAPAPGASTPPTLKLGDINGYLKPHFETSGAGLQAMGFEPAAKERGALLYHASDLPLIYAAMVRHIESLQAQQAA